MHVSSLLSFLLSLESIAPFAASCACVAIACRGAWTSAARRRLFDCGCYFSPARAFRTGCAVRSPAETPHVACFIGFRKPLQPTRLYFRPHLPAARMPQGALT